MVCFFSPTVRMAVLSVTQVSGLCKQINKFDFGENEVEIQPAKVLNLPNESWDRYGISLIPSPL